ncbi:MAG: uracil-DNA glycosylase family protein, partial [Ignavibacteria bacterium]|nr:uracil-DNA glycosylase family protein [Ignavibacteria bacterium]
RFAFSNTIRCRPKEIDPEKIKLGKQNRLPKDSEIKACSHYLDEEIKSLKKLKLIVALGAVALKRFFGKSGIKSDQARGTILNHPTYGPVLVTYHPAKPLHVKDTQERAAIESSIIEDYKKVGEFLRGGIQHKEADYKHYVVRNLKQAEWLFSALNKSEIFSFDIETSSFDYLDSKILSISFSWQNRTAVTLPFYYQGLKPFWSDSEFKKVFSGLKFVLENPAVKKIAHNGKFDMQHLRSFGIKVENFYADTMLMHYLIDENSFHDLKTLAWIYTDVGGYDREFDEERKKIARDKGVGSYESVSFADLPHEKLWKYSNLDADVTFRLFNIFWPMLKREKLEDIFFEFYMPM